MNSLRKRTGKGLPVHMAVPHRGTRSNSRAASLNPWSILYSPDGHRTNEFSAVRCENSALRGRVRVSAGDGRVPHVRYIPTRHHSYISFAFSSHHPDCILRKQRIAGKSFFSLVSLFHAGRRVKSANNTRPESTFSMISFNRLNCNYKMKGRRCAKHPSRVSSEHLFLSAAARF